MAKKRELWESNDGFLYKTQKDAVAADAIHCSTDKLETLAQNNLDPSYNSTRDVCDFIWDEREAIFNLLSETKDSFSGVPDPVANTDIEEE